MAPHKAATPSSTRRSQVCWCNGSLDVQLRPCRLRRLLCVAVLNITASYAKCCAPVKTTALWVRIRGHYVSRPSGKYLPTSQSQIPSPSSRGSKTGLVLRHPFVFCCMVGCANFSVVAALYLDIAALYQPELNLQANPPNTPTMTALQKLLTTYRQASVTEHIQRFFYSFEKGCIFSLYT